MSEGMDTPAVLEGYMRRVEIRELLQMLLSAGAITKPDAEHFCEVLARTILAANVGDEVAAYRDVMARHYASIADQIA